MRVGEEGGKKMRKEGKEGSLQSQNKPPVLHSM